VAAGDHLQTAIAGVGVVQIDETGDKLIRMGAPAAYPILGYLQVI
jgi:hypothetical protein